jgi:hypothetical protein
MIPINKQLKEFIVSRSRRLWIEDDILRVYVGIGNRIIDGVRLRTVDIANISQINQRFEGKGYFKRFMKTAESFGMPVYVESIQISNKRLLNILTKNGYDIIDERFGVCNCIKFPLLNA